MTRVVTWDDVEGVEVYPGIERRTLTTATSTVVRYTYQPGSVFPVHQHPEEQVTIVHAGTIEFTVGEQTLTLRAGDVAVIPGDAPHGARVTGAEAVVADNIIATANRAPMQIDGASR